ncbi:hypothetical protein DFH29DRAFT_999067 [Suillus ampliporus]|nr:hypothetical protein DFH29DRAFT_999067 [Suillus ampliporus]
MTTIYKRGPKTSLANYRGICCSNFLLNTPFAWLNSLLIPYLTRLCVLPEGQVATQPGVQGKDLTSFLSQLEKTNRRASDKLEPQGFYDAIAAYGLPQTIVDFDCSTQLEVPYRIHTAYGLTEPLTITGVTKQGGPNFAPQIDAYNQSWQPLASRSVPHTPRWSRYLLHPACGS